MTDAQIARRQQYEAALATARAADVLVNSTTYGTPESTAGWLAADEAWQAVSRAEYAIYTS